MKKDFNTNNSDKENLYDLTPVDEELKSLLQAWQTPTPSFSLDKKVLVAFRQESKQSFLQRICYSSIKVP
jgi:hypothetical protein